VHSSDVPELFNMTMCLAVATAISTIGVGTLVLLLLLADPTRLNWWHCESAGADSWNCIWCIAMSWRTCALGSSILQPPCTWRPASRC
jgi:hypothetical protein